MKFKNLEIPGPDLKRGEGRGREEMGGEDSLLPDPPLHAGLSV